MPRIDAAISAGLLFLLTGFLALQPLSTDLYLASLPALRVHFDAPVSSVQLTLSAFLAGFAISQLLAGPLSDRFGRRPVALGGAALYLAGSLLGAFAPSLAVLVAARIAQALGVCCTVVCARAIVRDLYEAEPGARVMSRALSWMGVVPIAGPVLGGLVQSAFGWRTNFLVLAAAGAAMLAATLRVLPETNRHRNPHATDLGPLLRNYALVASSRNFWANALPITGSYGALFCFISASSFVLIELFGVSERAFGFTYALVTLGYLLGTIAVRRVLARLGLTRSIRLGATVGLVAGSSMALLAALGVQSLAAVLVPMCFVTAAHGFIQPCCQIGAIDPFPRHAGAATALMGFTMLTIAAFAGWLVGALHDGTVRPLAWAVAASACFSALSAWTLLRNETTRSAALTTTGSAT
ncbi:MAG: multidrug effflux MFS transporter [Burkholderiaceae bacterium]|nr:multidrug effflux MFS transporter [Burkholderiaceae bacterium]